MQDSIIAGLISGLIVTLFIIVFKLLWDYNIVPWFEERIYKDAFIEGTWFSLHPDEYNLRQEIITLKRTGHSITGTMVCVNGKDKGEEYILHGSFKNMILPLIYESSDTSKTDRGNITLKSISNGEILRGKISLYNTGSDNITSGSIIWFRHKEQLDKNINHIKLQKEKILKNRLEKNKLEKELKNIELLPEEEKANKPLEEEQVKTADKSS